MKMLEADIELRLDIRGLFQARQQLFFPELRPKTAIGWDDQRGSRRGQARQAHRGKRGRRCDGEFTPCQLHRNISYVPTRTSYC
jgi:hypothetical protein